MKKFALLSIFWCLFSCYSFTGSSLSPDLKSINIKTFPNNSALNTPNLSQDFTFAVQQKFLRTTGLKGSSEQADLLIEGEISDYSIEPTSITSPNQTIGNNLPLQAAQNKLTVRVKVRFENKLDPKTNFEETFEDNVVFDSNTDTNTIETVYVKAVSERIINKMFNRIVANW